MERSLTKRGAGGKEIIPTTDFFIFRVTDFTTGVYKMESFLAAPTGSSSSGAEFGSTPEVKKKLRELNRLVEMAKS